MTNKNTSTPEDKIEVILLTELFKTKKYLDSVSDTHDEYVRRFLPEHGLGSNNGLDIGGLMKRVESLELEKADDAFCLALDNYRQFVVSQVSRVSQVSQVSQVSRDF